MQSEKFTAVAYLRNEIIDLSVVQTGEGVLSTRTQTEACQVRNGLWIFSVLTCEM